MRWMLTAAQLIRRKELLPLKKTPANLRYIWVEKIFAVVLKTFICDDFCKCCYENRNPALRLELQRKPHSTQDWAQTVTCFQISYCALTNMSWKARKKTHNSSKTRNNLNCYKVLHSTRENFKLSTTNFELTILSGLESRQKRCLKKG